MFRIIASFATLCGLLEVGVAVAEEHVKDAKCVRVYFVGNSVTDTINYGALAEMAKSRGYTQVWGRHMIPGAPLQWIWEHPKDGFQEPPFGYYPTALENFQWDALSLQPFDRHLDGKNGDVAMAKNFIDLALKKSPGLHVYVFARWPRLGKDGFDTAWQKKYTGKWDGTNETKDYFERLTLALRKAYPKVKIDAIPVGDAIYGLNQWMKAGKIPGYKDIHELYADAIHLNNVGSYVVGCTYFATLYKQSPRGLAADRYKVSDKKLAAIIQDLVWRVVNTQEFHDSLEWSVIANVMGSDHITQIHVSNLLLSKGIPCELKGSILYGTHVPKQNAEEAIRLLREDSAKRGYSIDFGDKVKRAAVLIAPKKITCLPASQLLSRPEFADDQPLGRWLRSAEVVAKIRGYPFVVYLEIYEREYLATQEKTETGYYIDLKLQPQAGDKTRAFLVKYQVWAQGRRIISDGGTEWKQ